MTHLPKLLNDPLSETVRRIARSARDGQLVLYVGAGLSMADPSGGPRGVDLADRLRPAVAAALGVEPDALADDSLEHLGQRVQDEASDHLTDLKDQASKADDFIGIPPNFGHRAIALLLRERLVEVASVNWDCGIENAGRDIAIDIEGVATRGQRQQITSQLPLYKVHGCALRPESLQLTKAEVDEPPRWAIAEVHRALSGGVVVFIGLGTVGLYVSEPVEELVSLSLDAEASIFVVDREGPSEAWRLALGEHLIEAAVAAPADEFLDDLLRAVALAALAAAEQKARFVAEDGEEWASKMVAGAVALRRGLGGSTAEAVLRWWGDGAHRRARATSFILGDEGRQALMAAARLAGEDGGELEISGSQAQLTIRSAGRYLEIVSRPGDRFSRVAAVARERVASRAENRLYGAASEVAVLIQGAEGSSPNPEAPIDIGGGDTDSDRIDGATEMNVRLYRVERLISPEVAAA